MFSGPHGHFAPHRYGHDLVGDLRDARLAWVSEEDDIGVGKGPYGLKRFLAAGVKAHPGGRGSPIVAEGSVFVASFRPVGPPYATDTIRTLGTRDENAEAVWDVWAIEAHDVLVAIDARSGRTRWKAVETRKGVRVPGLKRGGWGVSPAYHAGRVFSLGTTGRLYAYDARTGKKRWEIALGETHAMAEQAKAEALKQGRFAKLGGWLSSLAVADGVVVVPTFATKPRGLVGVDPSEGRILWQRSKVLSEFSTPAVVRTGGRESLLVNSGRGDLRLIDPRSGEVRWTVDGLGPYLGPLSPSDTHVVVNTRRAGADNRDKSVDGRWGAYRFTAEGAERAWQLPDERRYDFGWHLDAGPRRKVVVRDGIVYIGHRSPKVDGQRDQALLVIREATGEILQEIEPLPDTPEQEGFNPLLPMEDRLMTFYDVAHGRSRFGATLFAVSGSGTLSRLSHGWMVPHTATTGYEVPIEVPYVDGRLYFRTEEGTIVCYDVRQKADE
jgi:outer membrane protein assembly factor BamB